MDLRQKSKIRGLRNNNPGNLEKRSTPWQGKVPHSQNTDGRFEQFESMLEKSSGKLLKSAVELVKQWRNSSIPTKLEAMLIVADNNEMLLVSGTGEIIQPEDGILAIGSGGNYAYAAAKALNENTGLEAPQIAEKALEIAADICIFTNRNIIVETLGGKNFE